MNRRAILAILAKPSLWSTACYAAWKLIPNGWWRTRPCLPVPDGEWLRFRTETAYGGDGKKPFEPGDLITWLKWLRLFRAESR